MRSSHFWLQENWQASHERMANARMECAAAMLAAALTISLSAQIVPAMGASLPIDQPQNPAAAKMQQQIEQDVRMAGNFLFGKGVAKDPVRAAYWFRKAADLGDPAAQNEMGYLYVWGLGVDRDPSQAFKWFARSAGSGWQQAKLNLAVLYMRGIGVTKDAAFGRQLMTDLAQRGNARAQDYLGVMYLDGDGVAKDPRAAEEWFSRSAKSRNPEGEFAMGQLYSAAADHEHDYGKAAKYLRDSAKTGYVPAMYTLGVLLVKHPEVGRKGSGEAMTMLRRAAEAGTWQSSAMLGQMASQGQESPQDPREAFRWFTIAALQGGPTAQAKTNASLAQCRAALTAGEQDQEQRAAESWMRDHPHADLFVSDGIREPFAVGEVYAMRASAQ